MFISLLLYETVIAEGTRGFLFGQSALTAAEPVNLLVVGAVLLCGSGWLGRKFRSGGSE
jgi:hypothetical protein